MERQTSICDALPEAMVTIVGDDGTYLKIDVKRDGSFVQRLNSGQHYVMLASCRGYLNGKQELVTDTAQVDRSYEVEFPLASITRPVLIENIFYEFDRSDLTPASTTALDELIALLNDNPNVTIELAAHCDYKGNDAYNERLSQRRAESVVRYLIKGGISEDRLTAKGYGESKPKVVNKSVLKTAPFLKEGLMGIWMATSKRLAVKNTLLGIATLGVSIPGFVTAILLMMIFGVWWPVLPIVGLGSPANYILPVAAQSFGQIASIARLTKSTYSEAIQMDYVTMARAKGLSNLYITARHVLKNALIPVVTYFGPAIAFLITGSFVVESIFSIPGIGREFTNAITNRDYTVVLGFSVFIGVIITVANLAVDIICSLIDPRIKLTN